MIRATAMTEASRRNQIGQPAAWMMANNAFPVPFLAPRGRSDRHAPCAERLLECGDFSRTVVLPQVCALHQSRIAWRRDVVIRRSNVVVPAISTKICG